MSDFPRWRIGEITVTRNVEPDRYADRLLLIVGTHFAEPTAGRVVCDGGAYRFDA